MKGLHRLQAPGPSAQRAPDSFPRWFLWSAGAMVVVSLLSVATVRLTGNGPDQRRAALGEPAAPVERPLRFEDRANGAVAVIDARTGEKVAAFEGEQGFVRGALRALARHRKARGIGSEEPFELQVKPDGALTLLDPATGERIDIGSFGPTHAAAFAGLLAPSGQATR
jgi:putative photosynthetic complex assembly protein